MAVDGSWVVVLQQPNFEVVGAVSEGIDKIRQTTPKCAKFGKQKIIWRAK